MKDFEKRFRLAKKTSTAQLLFKCARLVNELALATLPVSDSVRPRPSHTALLPHIHLGGGTRITELAARLGITKQAVAQLVDDLEGAGFVARVADPQDRRAKRVVFTEAGLGMMLDGIAHLRSVERKLERAIGKDTMSQLRAALVVLHDHLDPP